MTIRVLLADDQALLRQTFGILLSAAPDMEVVGEAADGAQAIRLAREQHPDVIVMDIRMPGTDGLAATEAICRDPDLADTRILMLTTFETEEYVARALRAGASGFLGKTATADELLEAIRTVAAGDSLLSPQATRLLITRYLASADPASAPSPDALAELTTREREMTALAAQGLTNEEIATELVLSTHTVRTHIQRAMTKLHARDRAQLVVIAYRSGLVQP
ncbi:response regulator transcription factor [Streptomyces sp. NRRL S-813]|uniref:response regulator transcription factor n=1 Tax=Streptomyces sp. NRRL S-813 TaxID=1463919 RepID=UPI0004C12742|nr:response regulator transcription factor [Streptomyces sp. NRRL S-813]